MDGAQSTNHWLQQDARFTYGDEMLAVVVASIGLLGAALTVTVNRQLEHRRLFAEQLAIAYDRFAGGSQRRSAGIASLEGLRRSSTRLWKRHETAVDDFVIAQALYLLEEGGNRFEAHELANLRCLLNWIDPARVGPRPLEAWQLDALRAAIERFEKDASASGGTAASLGVHLTYLDELGERLQPR